MDPASMPLVLLAAYAALVTYAGLSDPPTSSCWWIDRSWRLCDTNRSEKIWAVTVITTASTRNIDSVKSLRVNEPIDYSSTSIIAGTLHRIPEGGHDANAIIYLVEGTKPIPDLNTSFKPQAAFVTVVGDKTSRHLVITAVIYPFFPRIIGRGLL